MSTATQPTLTVQHFHATEGARLWFTGAIDEHFPADAFGAAHGIAVIDLAGVSRVTSFGVREWCANLLRIDASEVYFDHVPSCMIAQFAMVAGFFGGAGQILSYQGRYECATCKVTTTRLFDRREVPDDVWNSHPPSLSCGRCRQPMAFADAIESLRVALQASGPLQAHPSLAKVAQGGEPPAGPVLITVPLADHPSARPGTKALTWAYPFVVHKQVIGKTNLVWLTGTLDAVAGSHQLSEGLEGHLILLTPGITSCEDSGLEVLARCVAAAKTSGGQAWLARCSRAFLDALARRPEALGAATIISVEHPVSCPACGEAPYFVTADLQRGRGVFCPRCGRACPPPGEPLAGILAKLPTAPPPRRLGPLIAVPPRARWAAASDPPRPGSRSMWAIGALGAVALLAVGADVVLRGRPPAPPAPTAAFAVAEAPRIDEHPAIAEAPAEPSEPRAAAEPSPAGTPRRSASTLVRPSPTVAGAPTVASPPRALDAGPPAEPVVHEARTLDELMSRRKLPGGVIETVEDEPELPAQLTQEQLKASMAALKDAVHTCYERFEQAGTVLVSGNVSPSGRLQAIELGGTLARSSTGNCVQSAARRASFPRFSGAPMPVTYPFQLP